MNSAFYQSGVGYEPNILQLYPFFINEPSLAKYYNSAPSIDLGTTAQIFDDLSAFNEKIFKLTPAWVTSQPTIELGITQGSEAVAQELTGYTVVVPSKQKPEALLDSIYAAYGYSNNLEIETIIKFKHIAEVSEVYLYESDFAIIIAAFINLDKYDYMLMKRLFSSIEFPIKDKFENDKIISFKYIYQVSDGEHSREYLGKLIFRRYGK